MDFHNQAVTSTQTYDDDLFQSFGGVKPGPNDYNTTWIWPALTALFRDDVAPPLACGLGGGASSREQFTPHQP